MASPTVDLGSGNMLFTIDSPSKSGQAQAGAVAALYFIPFLCLAIQIPACKGKYHAVLATCVFAAARGVGYIFRALAEKKVTKSRFEAYLILTSAATFLFIGALGDLLAHWFTLCSGKGSMAFTVRTGRRISVASALRWLYIVGIVFAIIGITAAANLFSASTVSDLNSAQHSRQISSRGFVSLMAIYTAFAGVLTTFTFKGPTVAPKSPSRFTVITALTAACALLLIRTIFGLLAVDHPRYSNQPHLLYSLEVLPEILALYIVAFPGFMPAVGRDAEETMGSLPAGTASAPVKEQYAIYHQGNFDNSCEQGNRSSIPAGFANAPPEAF